MHRSARTTILVLLSMVLLSAAPANIAGPWQFTVELAMGTGKPLVTFKQDGEKITGTYEGRYGKSNLEGTVKDNQVQFTVTVVAEGHHGEWRLHRHLRERPHERRRGLRGGRRRDVERGQGSVEAVSDRRRRAASSHRSTSILKS